MTDSSRTACTVPDLCRPNNELLSVCVCALTWWYLNEWPQLFQQVKQSSHTHSRQSKAKTKRKREKDNSRVQTSSGIFFSEKKKCHQFNLVFFNILRRKKHWDVWWSHEIAAKQRETVIFIMIMTELQILHDGRPGEATDRRRPQKSRQQRNRRSGVVMKDWERMRAKIGSASARLGP